MHLSASQLSDIKEMIRCAEDDLEAYRAEILSLESKVKLLSIKSDLLEKHTEKVRSLLSPVRRLPNEVLGDIFSYCCESNFRVSSSRAHRNTFLSVCSRWREVGLTTPQIWSVIYFGSSILVDTFRESDFTRTEVALRRHIELSKACPLDVTIASSFPEFHPREEILLQMLARCSNRWQRLSMKTPRNGIVTLPDLPILEMLHIHPHSICPKTTFPNKMQSLKHFSVNAFPGDATTFVPWRNILSLELDLGEPNSVDQHNLFGIVKRCTNLVTLDGTRLKVLLIDEDPRKHSRIL
ncbi:hypothetical protein K435DRAFT_848613 [Dendrothele bispora CBS 962.96]|uniref:Uncharacterized protein n=1 Tax=Dendrothele bispora (strain CBS 962.96) TaxID=1314807 RepID=A0A4S8MV02_DENBC|nr:hypothetical protein K435DRAFT_848613 [Dendrothele bispora CBS 962.96]